MSICARKLLLVLLIFSISVAPIFVSDTFSVDDREAAAATVDIAEKAMVTAYEAVLDAEESGADVSGLLVQLTVGGEHLAEARVWFSLEDFDTAGLLAGLCYDVAEEVRFEAQELRSEVYGFQVVDVFVKVSGSVVGVVVIVILSFMIWRIFKRRYRKNFLGMKPEVVSGES